MLTRIEDRNGNHMTELARQVTAIAVNYLGPAASVFLQRQAKMHLEGLAFGDLERKHLANLQYWVRISAGLLIDKEKAKAFAEEIARL
jgi:hypothetical protein